MGDEFAKMAASNKNYSEKGNQMPAGLLQKDRVDVAISEINIFNYFFKVTIKDDTLEKVSYHNLFGKNKYKYIFRTADLLQKFESGVKKIIQSGEIEKILKSYEDNFNLNHSSFEPLFCAYGNATNCN